MTETKQEVFEEVLAAYEEDEKQRVEEWGGIPDYEDYRARYAAATDGDPDCPYCHGRQDWQEVADGSRFKLSKAVLNGQRLLTVRRGEEAAFVPINFCPMCGRKLTEETK
ncbi:hypothetical protein [Lacticaseibacillus absianus]|uniref:hypothetical protein n=1 Tax=Lacticaseibacillus absianus TaxID=2729623 RepID=UPI0015CA17E8|nr:hypothetical protein [Lacticaseibacillus absianus]